MDACQKSSITALNNIDLGNTVEKLVRLVNTNTS